MNPLHIIAPSSKSIQREYVDKRLRQIAKDEKGRAHPLKTLIEGMQRRHGITNTPWTDTYTRLLQRLQAADLTINVNAGSWFHAPNRYGTYSQIYERAVGPNGTMTLMGNENNDANSRAIADDLVTIPEEWANAHPFSQRKRLHDALNATGASRSAGALVHKPDNLDQQKHHPTLTGNKTAGFTTTNTKFKPKAREVFAGLNFGRRAHGACVQYGWSHLVLKPSLKQRALYYPADTFTIAKHGTSTQCSYHSLGSLLLGADDTLRGQIWSACHDGRVLSDSAAPNTLIEAHIFKQIKIAEDVQALVLSRTQKGTKPPWGEPQWKLIVENATDWCERNGVRLQFAAD